MRRRTALTISSLALLGSITCVSLAQMARGGEARPADAGDTESIDSIIAALYDCVSGPAGGRDWDRFRGLFVEGARLVPVRVRDGQPAALGAVTVEGYIASAGAYFQQNAFYEREVARRTESFGHIAHVWTTYDSRRSPDEAPFSRGINSVQLFHGPDGWRIINICWDAERPGQEIPAEYLESR